MKNLKLAICNDHAGYALKNEVIKFLHENGAQEVKDFGCYSTESCDYADFAHPMAAALENDEFDFGIAICSSGNGISMTVNKHPKLRAALCWLPELAALARQHNDANVLSLPANFISKEAALEIVKTFFNTHFEGGRHERRVKKIDI